MPQDQLTAMLPTTAPDTRQEKVLLLAIRRMAIGGANDAHAAAALFGLFGRGHRRPLVLLRALMLELARAATRPILIAPCCCPRMTADEATLLSGVTDSLAEPEHVHARLSRMTAAGGALGVLITAQALAQAFADLGRPLWGE